MTILPPEGSFVTLRIIRETSLILGLNEEELKKYNVQQKGDKAHWNAKGMEEVEIDIGERAFTMICEALEKLDKEKKLIQNHYSLYEKFVEKNKNA